jgi:hypothetical protein
MKTEALSDQLLWGVEYQVYQDGPWRILYVTWHRVDQRREWYDGEPKRLLMFHSRSYARAWCAEMRAETKGCRFRPVRVRETVERA